MYMTNYRSIFVYGFSFDLYMKWTNLKCVLTEFCNANPCQAIERCCHITIIWIVLLCSFPHILHSYSKSGLCSDIFSSKISLACFRILYKRNPALFSHSGKASFIQYAVEKHLI